MSKTALATAKTERIEARVTPEQKEFFQWAASLEGRSFTDFVIRALQEAAEEAVGRHQIMVLTAREAKSFAEALMNPGEPGERLRRYARQERELLGE